MAFTTRKYSSDIIGDGTEDNSYRPNVDQYFIEAMTCDIPCHPIGHPQQGRPINATCISTVTTTPEVHAEMAADPNLTDVTDE